MQRAMAAEAEAAREARANVIAAEGEQKAAHALAQAANIIAQSPAALQVKKKNIRWDQPTFEARLWVWSGGSQGGNDPKRVGYHRCIKESVVLEILVIIFAFHSIHNFDIHFLLIFPLGKWNEPSFLIWKILQRVSPVDNYKESC